MDSKKKLWLFIFFIIASVIVAVVSGYLGFNISSWENFVSSNLILSAIVYVLVFVILTSFSFSVSALTGTGVLLFSIYLVIILTMIGIMGSSMVDFFISRKLGKEYVRGYLKKRGGKLEDIDKIFENNSFKTILILSAVFFVPPTMPNLLGGVININLKKYSIATFLGNLPNTVFTIYLINGLLYSNSTEIYISLGGLIITTFVALYFYRGEIKTISRLSFPWIFKKS